MNEKIAVRSGMH